MFSPPVPPQLRQFGSDPRSFILGFARAQKEFLVDLMQRMSRRTNISVWTGMVRGNRVTLRMVPENSDSTNAIALMLALWLTRSGDIVVDEAHRLIQNLPVGLEGKCDCKPAQDNPYLTQVAGIEPVTAVVIIAALAFALGVAIIVLPGLLELAATQLMTTDEYVATKEAGAEYSGSTKDAAAGAIGFLGQGIGIVSPLGGSDAGVPALPGMGGGKTTTPPPTSTPPVRTSTSNNTLMMLALGGLGIFLLARAT